MKCVLFWSISGRIKTRGGALLESPMRTAMHGKFRVSFAISVELNCLQYLFYHNKQNFRQFSHLWQ